MSGGQRLGPSPPSGSSAFLHLVSRRLWTVCLRLFLFSKAGLAFFTNAEIRFPPLRNSSHLISSTPTQYYRSSSFPRFFFRPVVFSESSALNGLAIPLDHLDSFFFQLDLERTDLFFFLPTLWPSTVPEYAEGFFPLLPPPSLARCGFKFFLVWVTSLPSGMQADVGGAYVALP